MRSLGLHVSSLSSRSQVSGPTLRSDRIIRHPDWLALLERAVTWSNQPFIRLLHLPRMRIEPYDALAARQCIEIGPRVLIGCAAQLPDLLNLVKV